MGADQTNDCLLLRLNDTASILEKSLKLIRVVFVRYNKELICSALCQVEFQRNFFTCKMSAHSVFFLTCLQCSTFEFVNLQGSFLTKLSFKSLFYSKKMENVKREFMRSISISLSTISKTFIQVMQTSNGPAPFHSSFSVIFLSDQKPIIVPLSVNIFYCRVIRNSFLLINFQYSVDGKSPTILLRQKSLKGDNIVTGQDKIGKQFSNLAI